MKQMSPIATIFFCNIGSSLWSKMLVSPIPAKVSCGLSETEASISYRTFFFFQRKMKIVVKLPRSSDFCNCSLALEKETGTGNNLHHSVCRKQQRKTNHAITHVKSAVGSQVCVMN